MKRRLSTTSLASGAIIAFWLLAMFVVPFSFAPGAQPEPIAWFIAGLNVLLFLGLFVFLVYRNLDAVIRRLVRNLVVFRAVMTVGFMLGTGAEMWGVFDGSLPFTLPEAPFGTNAQPTSLVLGIGLLCSAGQLLAAWLAFRREGWSGALFIFFWTLATLPGLHRLSLNGLTPSQFWYGMVINGIPTVGTALLLLVLSRRRGHAFAEQCAATS